MSGSGCPDFLVLGGGGFIGTNLCRKLVRTGAKVHAFGRSSRFSEALRGVSWVQGDFSDRSAVAQAVQGRDVVFHVLGSSVPESSNEAPAADLATGTLQSLHLLDMCRAAGVRRIVFASSGGTVYGIPTRVPIPEDAPTDPISAYGISKLAMEKYLGLYNHLYGLDYRVLRIANPYGPFQTGRRKQGIVGALIEKAFSGKTFEIWGTGEVVRDFIYVDDVVGALLEMAEHEGPHRVFNVGSGIGRSVNEVVSDVERVLDRGKLAVAYKPGRAADVPMNVLDITLIRRETAWSPRTDWFDGLRATAAWIADPAVALRTLV